MVAFLRYKSDLAMKLDTKASAIEANPYRRSFDDANRAQGGGAKQNRPPQRRQNSQKSFRVSVALLVSVATCTLSAGLPPVGS